MQKKCVYIQGFNVPLRELEIPGVLQFEEGEHHNQASVFTPEYCYALVYLMTGYSTTCV